MAAPTGRLHDDDIISKLGTDLLPTRNRHRTQSRLTAPLLRIRGSFVRVMDH
jgi:hypothetical protein